MQETWFIATWLQVLVVVGGLIFIVGLPMRLLSRSGRESVLGAIGLTVAVCVGLALLAMTFVSVRTSESVVTEVALDSSELAEKVSHGEQTAAVSVRASAGGVSERKVPAELLHHADVQTTPDGNVMWLPLSSDVLAELISEDGLAAIERLNASLPPELRQAYAMIPISAPGPGTGPAVDQVLSTPIVREALASTRVHSAVQSFLNLAVSYGTNQLPAEAPQQQTTEFNPPHWIENPGIGQLVIESSFEDAGVSALDALRPAMASALFNHATQVAHRKFHADGEWQHLVSLRLSDEAMQACIRETATREQPVTSVGTEQLMQKTYALVEFPDEVEQQVTAAMRKALQRDRALAVSAAVGLLWLGWMILGVLFRTNPRSSFLRRFVGRPVLWCLLIPCLAVPSVLVAAMVNGETFNFGLNEHPIVCDVRVAIEAEHPVSRTPTSGLRHPVAAVK